MNLIEDTTRAVTRTADLTAAAFGAVGGGVVGGTLGAIKGLFQGTAAGLRGGAGMGVLAVDQARSRAPHADTGPKSDAETETSAVTAADSPPPPQGRP